MLQAVLQREIIREKLGWLKALKNKLKTNS